MSMQQQIEQKLIDHFKGDQIEVVNESHMHSRGDDSHFKLTIVSDSFEGKRAVARHQQVYGLLADELKAGVHALAIHTYTNDEWQGQSPESPTCRGGSKFDQ